MNLADLPSEEVDIQGNAKSWHASRNDGKEGRAARDNHDDEESRNARTKLAIVVILADLKHADDISRVGGLEVDVAGVEGRGVEFVLRSHVAG
jgi:hypothetical protein